MDIDAVEEADKRAKLKLELIKLFIPRPINEVEEKDKDIRSAIYKKLSGGSIWLIWISYAGIDLIPSRWFGCGDFE